MSIPRCFHYYSSVIVLDVLDGDTSGSSFTVRDCFGYPGFLVFHMKLSFVLLRSVKNSVLMGFDGYCIESVDCFW